MNLLGVKYHNITRRDALNTALELLDAPEKSHVFFLNLDCLYQAMKDPHYHAALQSCRLLLPDGVGLALATRLWGGRMKENLNGTDFSPLLMVELARRGEKIYLLGGKPGVAESAANRLREKIPGIQIVGAACGFFEETSIIENINQSQATVLFVGLGAPLQEKWIVQHRRRLNPQLCLGVGALFDWISGAQTRSPKFLRRLRLEWFWRVMIEPQRMFKRYFLHDLPFLIRLTFYRFKISFAYIQVEK